MTLSQALAKWWHDWTEGGLLENCTECEIDRIAKDAGVSPAELRQLASLDSISADLLPRRMATLDLDREEVCKTAPGTFQDMQRVCSFCKHHRRCAIDLARNPENSEWNDYCPNVATLLALDAMPWATRREW